jgi:hypothetical protein
MKILSKLRKGNSLYKHVKNMTTKLSLTLSFTLLIHLLTYSQDRAGKFLAGGSFGFDFSKSTGDSGSKTYSISTSLTGGYFIINKLAVGIDLEYNYSRTNFESDLLEYMYTYDILTAPLVRYYIVDGLFVQGQVNIGQSKSEVKMALLDSLNFYSAPQILKTQYFTIGYGVGVGYDIRIKENLYIEPMVRYLWNRRNNTESDDHFNNHSIFLNVGLIFTL